MLHIKQGIYLVMLKTTQMEHNTIFLKLGLTAGKVIVTNATKHLLENGINTIMEQAKCKFTKLRNEYVRFSISYLIRIKIPDSSKYLLVRGHRIPDQLQPVGGVYKKWNGFSEFEKWGFKEDCSANGVKSDALSRDDLRFRIKGKHVFDVIKWFETRQGREIEQGREFREELINDLGFDAEIFGTSDLRLLRKVMKLLNFSTHHNCYEVLIYNVFELIPSDDQAKELKKLLGKERKRGDSYMIVDISEIEQLRVLENEEQIAKIGEHTKYLINEK
jgi:hypothetical protein